MKQVITIQLIITLIISSTLWIIVGKNTGMSYFLSSFAVVLPNLLLVLLSLWIKNDQVVFWLGVFVNKFITAVLLLVIAVVLELNWVAYFIGVFITLHIPMISYFIIFKMR